MTVKRRIFIRVISYLVAICVVFAAAGLFSQRAKAGYEETLGKVRMTNLGTMSEHFRDISAGLRLLAVSTENSFSDSSSYVEARVMGAKGCLNGFNAKKVKNISDYLDTLNQFIQSFNGTSEKRKIAVYLSEYARDVYYHLNDVSSAILNGAYSLTEYGSIYTDDGKPYFEDFVDYSNGNEKELFGAAAPASATAENIYFKEKVTEETAVEIAGNATGINPALWRKNSENHDVYSFRHGDTLVNVAKSGMICKVINPTPCRTSKISFDDAEKNAVGYLGEFGYKNLSVLRREKSEFTASFLFCPIVGGVLLLTCPITADICLSSGALTFMESYEYLKNYKNNIHAPENMPDISGSLPENLTAVNSRYCLKKINGSEKICIMTECKYNDYNYYVYIEPKTLEIIETENA